MSTTEELLAALKPCPFCGGEAERVDIDDGDNAGGSFVHCTACDASGNVEFGFKENFVSNWNRRAISGEAAPAVVEALDDLRALVKLVASEVFGGDTEGEPDEDSVGWDGGGTPLPMTFGHVRRAVRALRSLDTTLAAPQAPAPVGWRSMDSAPKDKTSIIIAVPTKDRDGYHVGEAYFDPENYDDGDWWWAGTSHSDYHASPVSEANWHQPTHWMPLPDSPQTNGEV